MTFRVLGFAKPAHPITPAISSTAFRPCLTMPWSLAPFVDCAFPHALGVAWRFN
jgi:hypothetical protein